MGTEGILSSWEGIPAWEGEERLGWSSQSSWGCPASLALPKASLGTGDTGSCPCHGRVALQGLSGPFPPNYSVALRFCFSKAESHCWKFCWAVGTRGWNVMGLQWC